MEARLSQILSADTSKMDYEELADHYAILKALSGKDIQQLLRDEAEGRPAHTGFIYLLSHEAMPGLLKIGFTSGLVEARAAQIARATGVPGPFRIERKLPVYSNPIELEKRVHAALKPFRVRRNREFFRISVEAALLFIRSAFTD
jgi:hypothetical protein